MTARDQPKPYFPTVKEGLRRIETGWKIALTDDMKHWRVWRPLDELGANGCFIAAFFDIDHPAQALAAYLKEVA